jgi:signal peptidase I
MDEFFRRRRKSKVMKYIMIGFLILGICLFIAGFVFLLYIVPNLAG